MVTNNAANNKTGASGTILQGQGVGTASDFSTATYPSTAGTAGKVLISDGTNIVSSTPTYPNASATSGKVIISDGTNFVASTPTFPNTATGTGTILRADGTNWVATTATYPSTTGANTMLISTSANAITTSTFIAPTSFTPVLKFGGGTTGITYTTQVAMYTQIGKLVYFNIFILLSNKGSSTGTATITGLPVTSANDGNSYNFFATIFSITATTNTYFYAGLGANATTITLVETNAPNGAATVLADTNFANNTQVQITGTYIAA